MPLPEAYRSLSRLSSALSAKASALCPFCLTFRFHHPSVGDGGLLILIVFDNFVIDVFLSLRSSAFADVRLFKDVRVTIVSAQSKDESVGSLLP